ncbi:hypothetical protein MN608_08464 [Microdochium nivale]|nr:hypothetical protein MN608_08464 [Microdochium nivale]
MRLPTSALLIAAALAAGAHDARECFNSGGTLWSASAQNLSAAEAWQPCSGYSGGVASYCSQFDYCMNNRLCINSGSDNMMSQQGCKSRTWDGEPCQNYCKGRTVMSVMSSVESIVAIKEVGSTRRRMCDR